MELSTDVFRPFFSRRHLAQLAAREDDRTSQRRDDLAAVLFVDVAGCTALSEEFGRRGTAGAEQLSAIFDRLFGRINADVAEAGGDIIMYAGDAVWAMWSASRSQGEEQLINAICLATRTALTLQVELAAHMGEFRGPSGHPLQLRASVGAGLVSSLEFGLSNDRSDFVVGGKGVREAARMDQLARPGEVVLSSEAWRIAGHLCEGTVLDGGGARVRKVKGAGSAASVQPVVGVPLERLRRSLPGTLVERLSADLSSWLAEFRALTVLFIGLPDFDIDAFDAWQPMFRDINNAAEQFDGEVYQLLLDEKGFTIVLAFGLPGRSHEDDAARGVHAALAICDALAMRGRRGSIGVTTGSAFCGVRGNDDRRQYTIVGPMMNQAARLMQLTQDEVRCDQKTVEAAHSTTELVFERLPPVSIRGRRELLTVFRPSATTPVASAASRAARSERSRIVGRSTEVASLTDAAAAVRDGGASQVILLEGDPGIGKTRLVAEVLRALDNDRMRYFSGAGLEIEQGTPYYAFQTVFRKIFDLDGVGDEPEKRRQRCLDRLLGRAELGQHAPLLGAVLGLDWPDNEATAALTAQGRAESTRELLLALLQDPERVTPTVLVIEDAHWLDLASWNLVLHAARRLPRMLLILTARPFEIRGAPYGELAALPSARTVKLGPLQADDVVEIVRRELAVDSIPASVGAVLSSRAAGNPFFATELAYALRDFGIIEIAGDRCVLGAGIVDPAKKFEELLTARGLPISLQGVTTSRMDRLPQELQVLLKLASVIGHGFDLPLLEAVFPNSSARPRLTTLLDELTRLGIIVSQREDGNTTYALRHAITQEIAYGTVPFAQRRQLHRAVAKHFERQEVGPQLWSVLAHHWRRAEEPRRAIGYLVKAGSEALRNYANEQGASFLSDALELDAEFPDTTERPSVALVRRGQWELDLGRAFCNWCRYEPAREHLERGLRLLGHGIARTGIGVVFGLLASAVRQALLRLLPGRSHTHSSVQRDRLLLASRSYEGLAETYFNTGANLRCVLAALASLNLAERAGPSPELARGYASIGAILGFIPAPKLARRYCDRALQMATQTGDAAALAWVSVAAGVFEAGLGEWRKATERFEQTHSLSVQLGDSRRSDDAAQNLAAVYWMRGDVANSLRVGEELFQSGERRSDAYMQAEGLRRRAYCLLLLGRYPEAGAAIDALRELRQDDASKLPSQRHSDVHALRALLHLRRAQPIEAEEQADAADKIQAASPPMFYDVLLDYSAVAEVYCTLREQRQLRRATSVRRACKRLVELARVFPVAQPAAHLWGGVSTWLDGKHARALRQWQKALELADTLQMPRYQALAHLAIGRHSTPGSQERNEHLTQAEELLRKLGDRYHLEQTHLWLGSSAGSLRRSA